MHRRACLLLLIAVGCTRSMGGLPEVALTDEVVARYVQAYRSLRALGPGIAERYQGPNQPGPEQAGADLVRIEGAVRAAGFGGYAEFVAVSGRLAWAMSQAEGQGAVVEAEARQREGEAQLQRAIDDPATPAEARAELQATLVRVRADYAHSRRIAGATLAVSGALTDRQAVEVVLRHRAELEAAFQGK